MRRDKVVVVGSANADLALDIDHRPAPGETILGSDVVVAAGGKGANQAVAAAKLGGNVTFIGCIGDDDHGRLLRASLEEAGADVSGLTTVGAPTGVAVIMLTPDGENSIIVAPGANRYLTPALLAQQRSVLDSADVVLLQLEIPLPSVATVATESRARVIVNAAPAAILPAEVLTVADPLVVNESEARHLLGEDVVEGADLAERLSGLGPRSIVLTLGPRGSVIVEPDDMLSTRTVKVPALKAGAVDTTGAGDSFVGAMAVCLADGTSLVEAVEWATTVAAVTVTRRGAQRSFPTLAELESGS